MHPTRHQQGEKHPAHGLRPWPGAGLRPAIAVLVAAAVALWPREAPATDRQFSTGSLIIPASLDYQTTSGVLASYGLVYIALWKNQDRLAQGKKPVTFYWAYAQNKLSQYRCYTAASDTSGPRYTVPYNDYDGCDFTVQRSDGTPVSPLDSRLTAAPSWAISYDPSVGPTQGSKTTSGISASQKVVKYLGGAWIIDATDRDAFLEMLNGYPELAPFFANGSTDRAGLYVNIHSANAVFTAPVQSVQTQKPPMAAVMGSSQAAFALNVLTDAGICTPTTIPNCGGTYSAAGFTSGVVYDYYANPADLLHPDASAGYPQGRLNGTVNDHKYGLLWGVDGAAPASGDVAQIATFLQAGNNAFVTYDAIEAVENSATHFLSTTGFSFFTQASVVKPYEDCNDTSTGTVRFPGNGGDCLVYGALNQPYAQTGNMIYGSGQGDFKAFTPLDRFLTGYQVILQERTGQTIAAARNWNNDPTMGAMIYLSGIKYDNARFWGERITLNTIFAKLTALTWPELARSEPVGYRNTAVTPATTRVYQGTFVEIPTPATLGVSQDVITFNPAAPELWQFPYTPGHLREYDLSSLARTSQDFGVNARWDAAAQLPAPGDRTIFTIVGGTGTQGWTRIPFDHTQTGSSCTDADGDGKCDLSQLFASCNAAGVNSGTLLNKGAADQTQARTLGMLVNMARGYCSAHDDKLPTGNPIWNPTSSDQCDAPNQLNMDGTPRRLNAAQLGGVDHASPAVVGPSRYITDTPYDTRPVVAYAAGRDGMLHAFYVSGTAGWSDGTSSLPAGVQPGQELWAFIPPGQVCGIATNNALVDGSINVIDVFGDFPADTNHNGVIDWTATGANSEKPTHVRRWRTVLIAAAGPGGSELFALDVTSPVSPVLLWHLSGASYSGTFDANDPTKYALKWSDSEFLDYDTTSSAVIAGLKSDRRDFRNLGSTYGTAVAKTWNGSAYQYLLFASSNMKDYSSASPDGFRGIEVFAIDVVTGEKVWQWEHQYASTDASGIGNEIPAGVALGDIDANGSTDRIYVGDMEGHLWELASRDGRNLNFLLASDGNAHSFPLFGTPRMTGAGPPTASDSTAALYKLGDGALGQQPLTTPIGEGRFTTAPTDTLKAFLPGRLALILGTMGVGWGIAPSERGYLYIIPAYPDIGTRLTEPVDLSGSSNPRMFGVLKPNAVWSIQLGIGERVYGAPRVVNDTIVFNTAFGSFNDNVLASTFNDPGNLWILNAGSTSASTTPNDAKAFGGALIINGSIVVTTDQKIRVVANPPASIAATSTLGQLTFNRATPAIVKTWEPVAQ